MKAETKSVVVREAVPSKTWQEAHTYHTPTRPEVREDRVVLELTMDEAQALMTVSGSIGGYPYGPRGVFDDIYAQLRALGFYSEPNKINGTIHFKG